MSANLIVLKPSFSDEMENNVPLALTALLPFRYVNELKIKEFFRSGPHPEIKILEEGTLVLERQVDPENSEELNIQAWAFAAELQLAFETGSSYVY
ncbi:MAG: hypothetical protein V4682_00980 [Patescibacteria group bacterium]